MNKQEAIEVIKLLKALDEFKKVDKILTTFIKAFKNNSILKEDEQHYLIGNFNIGGTKSGRLSSSNPNLQNIPSGSTYGKLIKSCFMSTLDKIFCGADFDSLEDKISALTTGDTNKLKVYLDKYDGHSLRAFSYFPERLPGIVDTVESINSIEDLFSEVRQDSKEPTFLLTYKGTYIGLIDNVGMSPKQAKEVEARYHELYKESDEWVDAKLEQATKDGYVTCAFGLRLRTPILSKTILNSKTTPYAAQSESRTAANALGQSWGLLNNRAAIEFKKRVMASEFKYMIQPVALIHDALYYIADNNIDCIHWLNKNLTECMKWQEHEEIKHDKVKLSGSLELYYPAWHKAIKLDSDISREDLITKCKAK